MDRDVNQYKSLQLQKSETFRPTNPGAEKWMGVTIPVLDHGFVQLVDYMGGDRDIEDAARVSYGQGTRKASETKGLVRYLMRHSHTSPFEMVEFKFHQKLPIFVARQQVRHRTANLNEYSGRYSILRNEFYLPEPELISVQSSDNKQGRGTAIDNGSANEVRLKLSEFYKSANDLYHWLLEDAGGEGIAKELARIPLPVAAYTEWYWKIDLHNLMHFLKLRMDPHAQYEIREFANAMATVVKDAVPIAWKAFEDYRQNPVQITGPEKDVLVSLLRRKSVEFTEEELTQKAIELDLTNKRERQELIDKVKDLGLLAK